MGCLSCHSVVVVWVLGGFVHVEGGIVAGRTLVSYYGVEDLGTGGETPFVFESGGRSSWRIKNVRGRFGC